MQSLNEKKQLKQETTSNEIHGMIAENITDLVRLLIGMASFTMSLHHLKKC